MNIPHDFSCHECSKNVYFIEVRNLEGQNHPGHTVVTIGRLKAPIDTQADTASDSSAYMVSHLTSKRQ